MKPVTVTTTIERPREELYALIADLRNHEAWTDHMLVDWSGSAERVRVRSAAPGPEDWLDIETTSMTPPSETVERTIGAGGKRVSYGTYRLRSLGPATTEVEFELRIEQMPRRERILTPLIPVYLRRVNRKALARLKEQAEAA
ncbi:MAG TPA: SRPBCC family protein [Solirubrobacteraceae bacterium]|nr:SRPBCC family protein [Solirubrobacteraceae bacterium]